MKNDGLRAHHRATRTNEGIAARNVADLEGALEQAEKNEAIRAGNERERDAARKADADARKRQDAERFKTDLRDRFHRHFPGAPESDFAAARPALLAEVAADARKADDVALDRARAAVRRVF